MTAKHEVARARRVAVRLAVWIAASLICSACSETGPESAAGGLEVLSRPAQAAAKPDPALWETPLDDPTLEAGRRVWTGTCIACHSTGLGGAPFIGRTDLWAPRVAQGLDVLFDHATNGFYGKKGEMPARGGNAQLSDAQVRSAVRFMVSKVDPRVAGG